jgi:hypothetical protein
MRGRCGAALIAGIAALAGAAPAGAGTYDVVSCGAPGAGGVNRAWQVAPRFDDRFWDLTASCPELAAWSERRPGAVAPNFTGAGFELKAPPGAILDRMVIWRTGYRFNSTGSAQGPWAVAGYRGDSTVIGGPFTGETCLIPPGQLFCRFGAEGAMAAGSRAERDLETDSILYSVACFDPPGCQTANADGFPFAGLGISGSVVTVREERPPSVIARGALLEPGWHTDDPPLSFGASDPVGIRELRVLVDGARIRAVTPACDFTAMSPCGQVSERAVRLGAAVPDGSHTLSVEAIDSAGNSQRVDRRVDVDRDAPALYFLPSAGGRRIAVGVADAGSGVAGGTIGVRRGRAAPFRALRARLRGGRLVARLARGSRAGLTIRAGATDVVGHRAEIVGAPVRLRAGFGRALRRSVRTRVNRRKLLLGRLTTFRGRPLPGREITVTQTPRRDGAAPEPAGSAMSGASGRFRLRLPAGASRVLRVDSPGTGGLQAARRTLRLRVPWSSSLSIVPRVLAPGGRIRLSGRLRLRGAVLPRSGKRVELQAFDRGRWRVFATTRTRGPRGRWQASYRFGTRQGRYRIRVRIPREGTVPFDRGYSRPVTVTVR